MFKFTAKDFNDFHSLTEFGKLFYIFEPKKFMDCSHTNVQNDEELIRSSFF